MEGRSRRKKIIIPNRQIFSIFHGSKNSIEKQKTRFLGKEICTDNIIYLEKEKSSKMHLASLFEIPKSIIYMKSLIVKCVLLILLRN